MRRCGGGNNKFERCVIWGGGWEEFVGGMERGWE